MDESLWNTLKPPSRFDKLKDVFDGITIRDICSMSKEEIVNTIENKLLAFRFMSTIVDPFLQKNNLSYSNESNNVLTSIYDIYDIDNPIIVTQGILNLDGLLPTAKDFLVYDDAENDDDQSLSSVLTMIKNNIVNTKSIKMISMRENQFQDKNINDIADFCDDIAKQSTNEEIFIDLSRNRFGHSKSSVKSNFYNTLLCRQLLNHPKVKFLVIYDNEFATFFGRDFFRSLLNDNDDNKNVIIEKLIWIPFRWLHSTAWHTVCEDCSNDIKVSIKNVHEKYYFSQGF